MKHGRTPSTYNGRTNWCCLQARTATILLVCAVAAGAVGESPLAQEAGALGQAAEVRCWSQEGAYNPPDFEAYFPDDREGALALGVFWRAGDRDSCSPAEALTVVRAGLRRYGGDPVPVIRWVGRRYVVRQPNPDPDAVELLYHAAGHRDTHENVTGIRGAAIHFGLSVLQPKPPAVLQALVAIAMEEGRPEILSRIAWGVGEQVPDALACLAPYRAHDDPAIREKARVVEDLLTHKLKAFDWVEVQHREYLEQNFRAALPRIYDELRDGDTMTRRNTLHYIAQEELMPIMGVAGIQAFVACASDSDAGIRETVAEMAGRFWIGQEPQPHPDAIALALQLSQDEVRAVRIAALLYGLSAVREKDEVIIRRLLEMAFEEDTPAVVDAVRLALRTQKEAALAALEEYIGGSDLALSVAARAFRATMAESVAER